MATKRISVRVESRLETDLRRRAAQERKTESDVVREALERYLQVDADERSAYDVAKRAGLIGRAKPLPADLSTNPKHLAGFGARR